MNTSWFRHRPRRGVRAREALAVLLLVAALVAVPGTAYAQNPAPVQLFYVTLPEPDGLAVLDAIESAANAPMYTYFSIAIGVDGTYVYYDHWEDGYAGDIANPTSAEIYDSATNPNGVQIWGNGESDDGCAPNINGVPFTCTDANDVLNAGDVIIPYNAVPVPRSAASQKYVLDQFGTVSYSNNDGNTNWAGDWVETGDYLSPNYRDDFGTQAYNNSDGFLTWTTSWTEVNDDGSPATGDITVNTTSGELEIGDTTSTGVAIYRAADLSGYTSATLSYSYRDDASYSGDAVQVQVRNPGSTGWNTLATIDGYSGSGTNSHDITGYIDSDTEVQFYVSSALESDDEIYFDNVDISLAPGTTPGTSPSDGDIQIINNQLRFTETDASDSIDRGLDLRLGESCATLSFSLGQSGIDYNSDRLRVQVSSDGTTYSTLETFESSTDAGSKSYDISSYAAENARVRFLSVDPLESGEYWTIDNVRVDYDCRYEPLFDGRDKVGASSSVAMARATWADGSGTLNAFAHEMYPTAEWGLYYESPVGTNTTAGTAAPYQFQYSALTIMASQNNTQVQIDVDANGSYETTVTLQEGGSYLATGILQGARVLADKAVQVVLLTGDIGDTYESRDMSLLPVSAWGSSYWSPVGVLREDTAPTRLYLYNLSTNDPIYITCERYGVADTLLGLVAAGGVVYTDLVDGQGAHCYASLQDGTATGDPIFAVGTVDTAPGDTGGIDGSRSDWSFTLYPDDFLSTDALVGLGLGKDPTNTSSTENGSPLWVTAACSSGSTYVYVDWNNDGTADLVDTNGDDVGEANSNNGITVNRLQSVRLFEPGADEEEYDQSGARVWSCLTANTPVRAECASPGCPLAVAWGQDPNNATAGDPGLDVGTSVPPLRLQEGTKSLTIVNDTAPTGVLNPGDTVRYRITVKNAGSVTVDNVYVHDTEPANTDYVANSTSYNKTGTHPGTSIADDPTAGDLPLAVTGGKLLGNLAAGETFYVWFDVTLLDGDYEDISNCDDVYTDAGSFRRCATNPVATKDWGDLPDTYGTTAAANGPRHSRSESGLQLGALWDYETQGVSSAATGDDNATSDDEDGVSNMATGEEWFAGNGSLRVTVAGGSGCLNAWMDFTGDAGTTLVPDGNFTKATGGYDEYTVGGTYSEHIIVNQLLTAGDHDFDLNGVVPAGLNGEANTSFYFRFRLTEPVDGQCTTDPTPTGPVTGGEVEDYRFDLGTPTAIELLWFKVTGVKNMAIALGWETASEVDNLGFNLYRAESADGERVKINAELIPTNVPPGSPDGAAYEYADKALKWGRTYYYWLEDVDIYGNTELHGPVEVNLTTDSKVVPPVKEP